MPIITSNEILLSVSVNLLNDNGFVRWSKQELLDNLNDAQNAVVIRRPDALIEDVDDFVCVEGTKQQLPSGGILLVSVDRNATGRAIRGPFDKDTLNRQYPEWHASPIAKEVELYLYNERKPKVFDVYPGVEDGVVISIAYSKTPHTITMTENDADAPIEINDIYKNALIEWMLYRCYSKDSEYADPNKSLMHLNAFKTQIGEKSQADGAMANQVIKE
jgi:hypothetical protein